MARGFRSAPGSSPEVIEAESPDLDRARLLDLGSSGNVIVRAAIAVRSDCPLGLMVSLAHDYSPDVRVAVAGNPRALRSVLHYLAADRSVQVVLAVIANPSLPEDILEELAFHKKSEVRDAASERIAGESPGVTAQLVEDAHTPELADHVHLGSEADWLPRPATAHESRFAPLTRFETTPTSPVEPARIPILAQQQEVPRVAVTRTAPVRGFRAPQA